MRGISSLLVGLFMLLLLNGCGLLGPEPRAASTHFPAPAPTWTPGPTWTPVPTWTPKPPDPTATSRPTRTPTPSPSPSPTIPAAATPTPVPTWTPLPTYTPFPTLTPLPTPTATPRPTGTPRPSPTVIALTTAEIVEQARPAIVQIIAPHWTGSGTIYSSDGHILTNWHVIEGLTQVEVLVEDSRIVTGQVLGYDEYLDLAVVKISGSPWPYLEVSTVRPPPGEDVLVIGYPLTSVLSGDAVVTRGIVSGFEEIGGVIWVQTDAAINPGNSGGAALNGSGKYIGVPTWKVVLEATENIAFFSGFFDVAAAIPELEAGSRLAASTPTPRASSTNWTTYTNQEEGYSVSLAPRWVVVDVQTNGVFIEANNQAALWILTTVRSGYALSSVVDEWLDFRSAQAMELFELVSRAPVSLASGLAGVRVEYRYQDDSAYCIEYKTEILLMVESRVIDLVGSVCEQSLDQYLPEIWAMQESFRIEGVVAVPTATPTPTPIQELPNLVPYQPPGWDAPLVVSYGPARSVEVAPPGGGPFEVGEELYLHWALKNISTASVDQQFQVAILLDGQTISAYTVSGIGPQDSEWLFSIPIPVTPVAGWHVLTLVVDSGNVIIESIESDNTYATQQLRWE